MIVLNSALEFMSNKKVSLSKNELGYLGDLLESELFKLNGVYKVFKKPEVRKTLVVAKGLQGKIAASL